MLFVLNNKIEIEIWNNNNSP